MLLANIEIMNFDSLAAESYGKVRADLEKEGNPIFLTKRRRQFMERGLELYKAFIDGLVKRKDGVLGKWIIGNGYPNTDDNKEINDLLNSLSAEQKSIVAKMVSEARIGGIHDTLAYMNEMMDCDGLEISQNGEAFPHDKFDSMHYDFTCRCEGDEWPE